MIVLGVDPGNSTGVAIIDYDEKGHPLTMDSPQDMLVMTDEIHLWYGLEDILDKYEPDICVYEGFVLYKHKAKQKTGSRMPAPMVIGVLNYLLDKKGIDGYSQLAAEGKGFYDNEKLKDLGFYEKVSNHRADALRHCLHYVSENLGKTEKSYKEKEINH